LFHCRMWCYAIGVEAVVLRSWCVVLCTVCQLVYYKHSMPPACFGHSCGLPQGSAIQRHTTFIWYS